MNDFSKMYGVFVWESDNMYRAHSATRVYKRECDAKKCADKLNAAWESSESNPRGFVVRRVYTRDWQALQSAV